MLLNIERFETFLHRLLCKPRRGVVLPSLRRHSCRRQIGLRLPPPWLSFLSHAKISLSAIPVTPTLRQYTTQQVAFARS